jgi:hypothetical protein
LRRSGDYTNVIWLILREDFGVRSKSENPHIAINRDLGIEGDDAGELMEYLGIKTGKSIEIDLHSFFLGEGILAGGTKNILTVEMLSKIIDSSPERQSD